MIVLCIVLQGFIFAILFILLLYLCNQCNNLFLCIIIPICLNRFGHVALLVEHCQKAIGVMFFFRRKVDVLRLFFLCCQRCGQWHIGKHRCPWNATAIKTHIFIVIMLMLVPPPWVLFWRSMPIVRIRRWIVMIVIRWVIRIRVVGSGLHILRRNNRGSRLCHDRLCCHCCWFRVRSLHSCFWRCLNLFCWCIRGDSSSGFCSRSGTGDRN